jgi:hypothetical protein
METKEEIVRRSVMDFFDVPENRYKFLSVVTADQTKNKISLRIINWFVTNYSKEFRTSYIIKEADGTVRNFKVHEDYDATRREPTKQMFDPFCRKTKELPTNNLMQHKKNNSAAIGSEIVLIPLDGFDLKQSSSVEDATSWLNEEEGLTEQTDTNETSQQVLSMHFKSSVRQLNFFKWVIENKIVEYIQENWTKIKDHMRQHSQKSVKKQAVKTKKQVKVEVDGKKTEAAATISIDNMISDNGSVDVDHEVPPPPVKKTSRRRRDDGAIFRTMKKESVDPALHVL